MVLARVSYHTHKLVDVTASLALFPITIIIFISCYGSLKSSPCPNEALWLPTSYPLSNFWQFQLFPTSVLSTSTQCLPRHLLATMDSLLIPMIKTICSSTALSRKPSLRNGLYRIKYRRNNQHSRWKINW